MQNSKHKSSLANKLLPQYPLDDDHTVHHFSKYVTLVEDTFGMLFDSAEQPILVKRFTWTNHNKISVSVITFGARISSMKIPDRGGNIEEIVLGFDDIAGYLFYDKYGLGATFGRTTSKLYRATYVVDGIQTWLTANDHNEHHNKGGYRGFDKVNWVPYVKDNVLQLSHLSPDGTDGYPGDLHVRITFELTTGAEFRVNIKANTSKVTPVDITNLTYVNLAGHNAGEEEIGNHELLINANCYTVMDEKNEFPTGEIKNVVHTRNNFQVPTLLRNVFGERTCEDYNQNFCINKGVHQSQGFVARLVHPYKGRVLEIYSNQCGFNFSNAGEFPDGRYNIPSDMKMFYTGRSSQNLSEENESVLLVVSKLAQYFREELKLPPEEYHGFLKGLMRKFATNNDGSAFSEDSFTSQLDLMESSTQYTNAEFNVNMMLKPLEVHFLMAIKELLPYVTEDLPFDIVKDAIDEILANQPEIDDTTSMEASSFIKNIINKQISSLNSKLWFKTEHLGEGEEEDDGESVGHNSVFRRLKEEKASRDKEMMRCGVPIPPFYKKERITGRGGVVYKKYGAISLRTQGYPNALQHSNFPSQILRPNETYTHSYSYKFWILSGNPDKWMRRLEMGPCVAVSDLATNPSSVTMCDE